MLRKMKVLAGANMQVSLTYKTNFLLGIVSVLVMFLVHYNLWEAIYRGNNTDMIGGYTFIGMVVYIAVSRILYVFVSSLSIEGKVADEIKNGKLSMYIIKPMNYLFYNVSAKLGSMILQFIITITISVILFIFVIRDVSIFSMTSLLIAILTALWGTIINMLIGYIFALTAFWMEQVDVMFILKRLLMSFISGVWIPLSFFPSHLRRALDFLPFKYIQYFSVNILLGHETNINIIQGITIQIFWILLLLSISQIMWVKGVKKYTSIGG